MSEMSIWAIKKSTQEAHNDLVNIPPPVGAAEEQSL